MKKITLDRELFYSKLSKAIKFVSESAAIPGFENFLFEVSDRLKITATDGNVQVSVNCEVKATEKFSMCVPAKLLIKTVNLFRENEVVITMKADNLIEIKSGKSKYKITLTCFPENYPLMPDEQITSEINMHQHYLKMGLKQSEKFADEDTSMNISGINIIEVGNKIIFTGTTKQMMCRVAIKPISINKWEPVTIPPETANKVASLLDDKGEVSVVHSIGKIMFFTDTNSPDSFIVKSTIVSQKYPNTEMIFNKKPDNTIILNTLEFRDAVKRLALYSTVGVEPSFGINCQGSELRLISEDTLSGKDGEEFISLFEEKENIPLHKHFKSDYFIQVLSAIESNEFILHFDENTNVPVFIIPKVETQEEDIFSFLISGMIASPTTVKA